MGAYSKKKQALERNTNILTCLGCNQSSIVEKIECAKKLDPQTVVTQADEYFY
jgi:hypothetical protein